MYLCKCGKQRGCDRNQSETPAATGDISQREFAAKVIENLPVTDRGLFDP